METMSFDRRVLRMTKMNVSQRAEKFDLLQAVNDRPLVPRAKRVNLNIKCINRKPEPFRRRMAIVVWAHFYNVPIIVNFIELAFFVLCSTLLFAAVLYAHPDGCCADPKLTFPDHFDFAFQTVSSIGYGAMTPHGLYANFWTFWMGLLNICWFGLTGGVLYAKFTKTPIKLTAADVLVMHNINENEVALQLRVGFLSHDLGRLVGVSARLQCQYNITLPAIEGKTSVFSQTEDLRLVNPNPRIDGVVTLVHLVTEESVMWGWTAEEMIRRDVWVNVVITGRDKLSKDVMVFQERFQGVDVMIGYRYRDQLVVEGNNWTFDYALMSEIAPTPVWYPKTAHSPEGQGHAEDQNQQYLPLEIESDDMTSTAHLKHIHAF